MLSIRVRKNIILYENIVSYVGWKVNHQLRRFLVFFLLIALVQVDGSLECGAACPAIVMAYYEKWSMIPNML